MLKFIIKLLDAEYNILWTDIFKYLTSKMKMGEEIILWTERLNRDSHQFYQYQHHEQSGWVKLKPVTEITNLRLFEKPTNSTA